mmetsp:Transcript_24896/g.58418  ORF Transcript_24896/g.58418 Transcript_24896/m.58418 type:complete len:524 (+) Transcript_24896:322-1893(+)
MLSDGGEGILSKEWLRLSLKDRIDIQEEIHSVFCIAPEESPEMIQESLKKFAFELDNNIPAEEQRAFLRCQELCHSAKSSCYINEDDFRLRFLRLGLFDIPEAARRMCKFLGCLLEGFGEASLLRPVTLTDSFCREDLKHLRKGYLQILPYRDRLGRRILVVFPGLHLAEIPVRTKMKIILYLVFVAGYNNNGDIQRKGFVALIWFDPTTKLDEPSSIKSNIDSMANLFPVVSTRIAAIHVCTPDTPTHRLGRSLLAMALSIYERTRLKMHTGTPMELRYVLNSYGIPSDSLPVSWTGKIKIQYLKQWMKTRQIIEHDDDKTRVGSIGTLTKAQRLLVVECPELNDIVFKKGTSGMLHPGNVRFRSLVQSRYEQGNLLTTASLIAAILKDIERENIRVVVWNEKVQYFSVVINPQVIYKKIEYLVRDFQFSSTKSQKINRQTADAIVTNASTPEVTSIDNTSLPRKNMKNMHSAASIFSAQDGSSRKKFRTNDYSSDSSTDESERTDCSTNCCTNCGGEIRVS